jgi:hypothetical protein
MEAEESPVMYDNEDLELVRWLIDRFDNVRESIATRAAIVLSADAILLAGTMFLLGSVFSDKGQYQTTEQIVLALSITITMFVLSLSIFYATTGVLTVWKTSRELYGADMPPRLFFHARDTVETFRGFEHFQEHFRSVKKEEMTLYALGELWTVTSTFHRRYQYLRKAIKFLLVSMVPFLISIAVMLFRFLL